MQARGLHHPDDQAPNNRMSNPKKPSPITSARVKAGSTRMVTHRVSVDPCDSDDDIRSGRDPTLLSLPHFQILASAARIGGAILRHQRCSRNKCRRCAAAFCKHIVSWCLRRVCTSIMGLNERTPPHHCAVVAPSRFTPVGCVRLDCGITTATSPI